ncbi:hypothetical protein [Mesorhizobium sp. 131-2-1]|uniref:hypothetical protein n=1 Tax=Mesorhizobium sp. 131-2-1 TaxID=2744518 RepID=UPI0019292319|nr:hypothetical protein [Mesorhizobium sp. 131-2-1]
MEMTLSDGALASYSCGVRFLDAYLAAALFCGTGAAVLFLILNGFLTVMERTAQEKAVRYAQYSFSSENAAFLHYPMTRTTTRVLLGIAVAGVLLISFVLSLSPLRARLFATETSIIETGCHVLKPYREVFDRNLVEFQYQYGRGKGGFDALEISQTGKRSLSVDLRGSPYLKNLVALAPEAMNRYFDELKAEGKALPQL